MTSGLHPEVDTRAAARQWAAETLGVDENAAPADAKRAYFRKIRQHDFLPPLELLRAVKIASQSSSEKSVLAEPDEEYYSNAEARLRDEASEFASQFFELAPPERRNRWRDLLPRSKAAPSLTAWLRSLEVGLDVEPPASAADLAADQSVRAQLIRHLLHAFPRPPFERVVLRQALVRQVENFTLTIQQTTWQKAARNLKQKLPMIAELDEKLMQQLADLQSRLKRRDKLRDQSQRKVKSAPSAPSASRFSSLAIVAIVVAGALSRLGSHDSTVTPPTYVRPPAAFDYNWNHEFSQPPKLPSVKIPDDPLHTAMLGLARSYPPVEDLSDPEKFDVEMYSPVPDTITFKPRPQPHVTVVNGGDPDKIFVMNESIFILIGGHRGEFAELKERAKRKSDSDLFNPPRPESP